MDGDDELSTPPVGPTEETVISFWRKISYLTTRTRTKKGDWLGSPEVKKWNLQNMHSCDKCSSSRILKHCVLDDDQASCRPCRDAKMACDRKVKFLFESTREDFFPTMDLFLYVYNGEQPTKCRSFQKTANKKRKADLPFSLKPDSRVVITRTPAIASSSANTNQTSTDNASGASGMLEIALQELRTVRRDVEELRTLHHEVEELRTACHEAEELRTLRREVDELRTLRREVEEIRQRLQQMDAQTHLQIQGWNARNQEWNAQMQAMHDGNQWLANQQCELRGKVDGVLRRLPPPARGTWERSDRVERPVYRYPQDVAASVR
ncbi:hypothetical protein MVEN_00310800 [Mycena venus]|uniref:Uncharacterized protein n=1 Tax=Mycena venus TaxID=2733690 RepID=A0A8H6Z4L7_9AGAR|nr:hypothetical protein MVEN_00310800 [Mycena venus]